MSDQFGRAYTLEIGEADPLGLTGGFAVISSSAGSLRMAFEVSKDERPWPNKAEIRVWNLNPTHREYLASERGLPCQLEAGYSGSTGVIFRGMVRQGTSVHDGTDWVTTIRAGDGELNRAGEPLAAGSIRKSWKRGTPVAAVLTDFATELDVDLGNLSILGAAATLSSGPALASGLTVDGPIIDEWIDLLRSLGLTWSIQDGAIQLRAGIVPAGIAPVISPFTGLIGGVRPSTRQTKRTNAVTKETTTETVAVVEGTNLLLPGLIPGHQFMLQSSAANGVYLCSSVTHEGDTEGESWFTQWEGLG